MKWTVCGITCVGDFSYPSYIQQTGGSSVVAMFGFRILTKSLQSYNFLFCFIFLSLVSSKECQVTGFPESIYHD